MGADRAVLVQVGDNDEAEPLAVAKIVKGVAGRGAQLIIAGKQAIDDDLNQVGQMVAALMGRPQGTFRQRSQRRGRSRCGEARSRRRARDGQAGAAGDRHHGPAPQRAALCLAAQHHEGQVQAARDQGAGDYGVDIARASRPCC